MNCFTKSAILLLGMLLPVSMATAETASIQMLPPLGCPSGTSGIISWDNANPLGCVPNVTADQNGDIATTGSLSGSDYCIAGVGCSKAPVPRNFSCSTPGTGITGFDNDGNPQCNSVSLPSCPDGQTIIYSGGVAICTSPATGTPVTVKTGVVSGTSSYNDYINNGIAAVFNPADTADISYAQSACLWTGDSASDQSQFNSALPRNQCQELLCAGLFGTSPKLYSLTGWCTPGAHGQYTCTTGLPGEHISCFY